MGAWGASSPHVRAGVMKVCFSEGGMGARKHARTCTLRAVSRGMSCDLKQIPKVSVSWPMHRHDSIVLLMISCAEKNRGGSAMVE